MNRKIAKKLNWMLRIVLFSTVFICLFIWLSYTFRPSTFFANNTSTYEENAAQTDVLFVGGSTTYAYWQPLYGFNDYGLASYSYSGPAMSPVIMKDLLTEARKSAEAKLYVIDLRALHLMETRPEVYTDEYMRVYTDAIPYSVNRNEMIKNETAWKEASFDISNYVDLIYYHDRWRDLNWDSWKWSKPAKEVDSMGFHYLGDTIFSAKLEDYSGNTNRAEISPAVMDVLNDILQYCKDEEMQCLFTLNVFECDESIKEYYNTVGDIVSEYGYSFINTNDYWQEIGIDPEVDFYDNNHLNVMGALKYTWFLGGYIIDNYELPDRRTDPAYSKYYSMYEKNVEKTGEILELLKPKLLEIKGSDNDG